MRYNQFEEAFVIHENETTPMTCNTSFGDRSTMQDAYSAVGGVLLPGTVHETMIVCNGLSRKMLSNCYFSQNQSHEWTRVTKRSGARYDAASIVIDNGKTLWITGGQWRSKALKSTHRMSLLNLTNNNLVPEINHLITPDSFSSKSGPNLPVYVKDHCLVKLNDSTAMMMGGRHSYNRYYTYSYYLDMPKPVQIQRPYKRRRWSRGPRLNAARVRHSCGVLTIPNPDPGARGRNRKQVVIVVS